MKKQKKNSFILHHKNAVQIVKFYDLFALEIKGNTQHKAKFISSKRLFLSSFGIMLGISLVFMFAFRSQAASQTLFMTTTNGASPYPTTSDQYSTTANASSDVTSFAENKRSAGVYQFKPGTTNTTSLGSTVASLPTSPTNSGWVYEGTVLDGGVIATGTWTIGYEYSITYSSAPTTKNLWYRTIIVNCSGGSCSTSTVVSPTDASAPASSGWSKVALGTLPSSGSLSGAQSLTFSGSQISVNAGDKIYTEFAIETSTTGSNQGGWKLETNTSNNYITTPNVTFPPTQMVFTTSAISNLAAGTCSGAVTVELQNGQNAAQTPSSTTTINISSNTSGTFTTYSDPSCQNPISGNNLTYTTSDTDKTFYITDTKKGSFTLTAHQTAGTDTISDQTQGYSIAAGSVTKLVVTLPGETFTDGSGNSGSVTGQTAGSSFTITSISATDNYFNVNTGYSGTKTLSYSGPSNSPGGTAPSYTTSVAFTSGQSTTTLTTTLYKAETTNITVTEAGNYGTASSNITVAAAGPSLSQSTVSSNNSSTTLNSSVTLTITILDAYQNPVGSYAGSNITLTNTTSTFSVTSSPTTTDNSGVSTAQISWSDAGTKTVKVTLASLGDVVNTTTVTVTSVTKDLKITSGVKIKGGTTLR